MMTKYLYCVYDSSAQAYGDPIVSVSDAVAARSFRMEAENKDSIVHRFPVDFTLRCVAAFDTVTGKIDPLDKVICRGTDFIEKE